MVSNFYIQDTIGHFDEFAGVYSADSVKQDLFSKKFKSFQFIIVNTEELQSKVLGHWVSISRYFKNGEVILEFFDSFGYPLSALHKNIQNVIKKARFQTFITNNKIIQHPESNYCGFFAIARFLSLKLDIGADEFLTLFSSATKQNDSKVIKYIRKYFNKINQD